MNSLVLYPSNLRRFMSATLRGISVLWQHSWHFTFRQCNPDCISFLAFCRTLGVLSSIVHCTHRVFFALVLCVNGVTRHYSALFLVHWFVSLRSSLWRLWRHRCVQLGLVSYKHLTETGFTRSRGALFAEARMPGFGYTWKRCLLFHLLASPMG